MGGKDVQGWFLTCVDRGNIKTGCVGLGFVVWASKIKRPKGVIRWGVDWVWINKRCPFGFIISQGLIM